MRHLLHRCGHLLHGRGHLLGLDPLALRAIIALLAKPAQGRGRLPKAGDAFTYTADQPPQVGSHLGHRRHQLPQLIAAHYPTLHIQAQVAGGNTPSDLQGFPQRGHDQIADGQ